MEKLDLKGVLAATIGDRQSALWPFAISLATSVATSGSSATTWILVAATILEAARGVAYIQTVKNIPPVPVIVCIGKSHNMLASISREADAALRSNRPFWKFVLKRYHLIDADYTFFHGGILKKDATEWTNASLAVSDLIERLQGRMDEPAQLHLFLLAPSSLCFCCGALLGKEQRFTLYHHIGTKGYRKVYCSNDDQSENGIGQLQKTPNEFNCITVEVTGSDDAVISICVDLTSHKLKLNVHPTAKTVWVRYKRSNERILPEEFLQVAQESAAAIRNTLNDSPDASITIYLSTPVSIAWLIGRILGPVNARITEYNMAEESFNDAISLSEVRLKLSSLPNRVY